MSVSHAGIVGRRGKRGGVLRDDAHFLHPGDARRAHDLVAFVVSPFVFVEPVIRHGKRTVAGLIREIGEERLGVVLVLVHALDDEIAERLRGEMVVGQFFQRLAIERKGEARVRGIGVTHVAPVAAAALHEREVPLEPDRGRP